MERKLLGRIIRNEVANFDRSFLIRGQLFEFDRTDPPIQRRAAVSTLDLSLTAPGLDARGMPHRECKSDSSLITES